LLFLGDGGRFLLAGPSGGHGLRASPSRRPLPSRPAPGGRGRFSGGPAARAPAGAGDGPWQADWASPMLLPAMEYLPGDRPRRHSDGPTVPPITLGELCGGTLRNPKAPGAMGRKRGRRGACCRVRGAGGPTATPTTNWGDGNVIDKRRRLRGALAAPAGRGKPPLVPGEVGPAPVFAGRKAAGPRRADRGAPAAGAARRAFDPPVHPGLPVVGATFVHQLPPHSAPHLVLRRCSWPPAEVRSPDAGERSPAGPRLRGPRAGARGPSWSGATTPHPNPAGPRPCSPAFRGRMLGRSPWGGASVSPAFLLALRPKGPLGDGAGSVGSSAASLSRGELLLVHLPFVPAAAAAPGLSG